MKNVMQLKAIVKNIAVKKKISAQLVLQNYMMERFLERVSVSKYKNNFIIKGGFLIASMVGLDTRATMDIDATIKQYPVKEDTIKDMIQEIIKIKIEDDINFVFTGIEEIRENDEYSGYRVALSANYQLMSVPLKMDITSGDKIIPKEINYKYKLMFEDREIKVLAYNLETILAEKLEAIISRGDQSTRPRDYYDVYILTKTQSKNIDLSVLLKALSATAEKRGSSKIIKEYKEILETVKNSDVMNTQWNNYRKIFDYAKNVEFSQTVNSVINIIDSLMK